LSSFAWCFLQRWILIMQLKCSTKAEPKLTILTGDEACWDDFVVYQKASSLLMCWLSADEEYCICTILQSLVFILSAAIIQIFYRKFDQLCSCKRVQLAGSLNLQFEFSWSCQAIFCSVHIIWYSGGFIIVHSLWTDAVRCERVFIYFDMNHAEWMWCVLDLFICYCWYCIIVLMMDSVQTESLIIVYSQTLLSITSDFWLRLLSFSFFACIFQVHFLAFYASFFLY